MYDIYVAALAFLFNATPAIIAITFALVLLNKFRHVLRTNRKNRWIAKQTAARMNRRWTMLEKI